MTLAHTYRQSDEDWLIKDIGRRIREARLSREPRLSQEKLGDALGTSFQMIQKYENGTCRISAAKLILAARALQLPPAFLLMGFEGIGES